MQMGPSLSPKLTEPFHRRNGMPRVALGTRAPEIDLEDFSGNRVRLSDFRGGHHVLLVFNRGFT
jgi:hypothetical protein